MIDSQLSKQQILELYLNRIYLSAGVYGVETMSQHLFRQAGEDAEPRGVRARSPGSPARRPRSRRGPTSTARAPAATSCWRGCARKDSSPRRRSARRRRAPHPHRAVPRRDRSARRLRQGVPAPAVPRSVRRRPSARLGRADDVRAGAAGGGRARRRGRACGGSATRSSRRRSSRSIRATATSSRWSAGAISGCRSSTAPRAAAVSRAPPSSRCCTPPRSTTGSRRSSVLDGLANIAPQGPDEWAPRNASGDTPDALTLRAALHRVEQPRRDRAAAAPRIASGPAARLRRRARRPARRAVAVARHRATSRRSI